MGCGMEFLRWLSDNGYLPRRGRVLDIGESCLLSAREEDLRLLVERHGGSAPKPQVLETFAKRSVTFGHPTIPTLFLSELLDLTEVEYVAFDVVRARKAERFDMNIHDLAAEKRNSFDLCLNFGTTEHLINQMNAFKVMHEAVRPGGYLFHQVPATGYVDHGYFHYNPMMFRELGQANGYETVALWYYGHGSATDVAVNPRRYPSPGQGPRAGANEDGSSNVPIPNSLINVLFRKVHDAPFKVALEVATAAGALCHNQAYDSEYVDPACVGRPRAVVAARPRFWRRVWRRLAG